MLRSGVVRCVVVRDGHRPRPRRTSRRGHERRRPRWGRRELPGRGTRLSVRCTDGTAGQGAGVMDTEGTFDSRGTRSNPVPRPASATPCAPPRHPRRCPAAPPRPPPDGRRAVVLRRLAAHSPPGRRARACGGSATGPGRRRSPSWFPPGGCSAARSIALLCGWLLWSLLWNGYLGGYWLWPLARLTPDSWRPTRPLGDRHRYVYYADRRRHPARVLRPRRPLCRSLAALCAPLCRRAGAPRRAAAPRGRPRRLAASARRGPLDAAQRLGRGRAPGALSDVDYARIRRAWQGVRARPERLAAFTDTVLRARRRRLRAPLRARATCPCAPPPTTCSPARSASAPPSTTSATPTPTAAPALALEPALLGTSLLAVGPPGVGQDRRGSCGPSSSRCALQALAGRAAVVAVGAAGRRARPRRRLRRRRADRATRLRPRPRPLRRRHRPRRGRRRPRRGAGRRLRHAARRRQPARRHRARPAARPLPRGPRPLPRRAGAARAAGRRARRRRRAAQRAGRRRATQAHAARTGRPGAAVGARRRTSAALLADRLALLDRPAFAELLRHRPATRPALLAARPRPHPLRVRIDLPERGHAEASRMLARLVLAQFTASRRGPRRPLALRLPGPRRRDAAP